MSMASPITLVRLNKTGAVESSAGTTRDINCQRRSSREESYYKIKTPKRGAAWQCNLLPMTSYMMNKGESTLKIISPSRSSYMLKK